LDLYLRLHPSQIRNLPGSRRTAGHETTEAASEVARPNQKAGKELKWGGSLSSSKRVVDTRLLPQTMQLRDGKMRIQHIFQAQK
jgi:hypothetical protein